MAKTELTLEDMHGPEFAAKIREAQRRAWVEYLKTSTIWQDYMRNSFLISNMKK